MKPLGLFSLIFAAVAVFGQPTPNFICEDDGYFQDPEQCDKYYICYQGKVTEKLCPDGLVFDGSLAPGVSSCNYPFLTECPENSTLQRPNPIGDCQRQNGYFPVRDLSICDQYVECTNGLSVLRTCHKGLHFDPESGTCHWANKNVRTGCGEKKPVSLNGFTCPRSPQFAITGHRMIHARYLKEDDCRYYYVCIDGTTPTLTGCPEGLVFNDITLQCDDPLFVPGCENYYGAPIYYDYVDAGANQDPEESLFQDYSEPSNFPVDEGLPININSDPNLIQEDTTNLPQTETGVPV